MIYLRDMMAAIWSEIGDRYSEGMSLDLLAKRHRTTRHAITVGLQRRGLFVEGRKNKPLKDQCVNGDDLAVYGVQMYKQTDAGQVKNGRVCSGPRCREHKRQRQRASRAESL